MKREAFTLCLCATISTCMFHSTARAEWIMGEAMRTWNGCDDGWPHPEDLEFPISQVQYWGAMMKSLGHTNPVGFWSDYNVWASDVMEDAFGGDDRSWADSVQMYAYSGHGTGPNIPPYGQTFRSPFCHPGSWTGAWVDSQYARFGETGNSPEATPYFGRLRWVLWMTCYSVDVDPGNQWAESMWYGTDVIMGYRGTSTDSFRTDEVGEDLAMRVWQYGDTFKAAWFYAVDDFWVDDVGSLIASGRDGAESTARRDSLSGLSPIRPWGQFHSWFAWSWHVG